MTTKQVLAKIDAQYERVQQAMLDKFDNEGADIGDASCAGELIGNNAMEDGHDNFTPREFLQHLADTINIPFKDLVAARDDMRDWTNDQWKVLYGKEC